MKTLLVSLAIILPICVNAQQEEKEFVPSGKTNFKVFANFHHGLNDSINQSAFELKRAYLGYKYSFAKEWSSSIMLDVGNPGAGSLSHTAYFKNAALSYKKNKISANFGLISTVQFKAQENHWNHRYVYKSFQDEHKFGSSADLGFSASYKIANALKVDAIVMNGEGYKNIQSDNKYRTGVGLTATPTKELTIRAYTDFIDGQSRQMSIACFIGYKTEKISVGGEYNNQQNHKTITARHLYGGSFYGSFNINKKTEVFARYDQLSSSNDWNLENDGYSIIGGLQLAPTKGIKIALNYQGWEYTETDAPSEPYIYLNFEYKL